MSTMKPANDRPVCRVPGCTYGAQIMSVHGGEATYLKTCARHTFKDLPDEQEKLNTFWPPIDK